MMHGRMPFAPTKDIFVFFACRDLCAPELRSSERGRGLKMVSKTHDNKSHIASIIKTRDMLLSICNHLSV